MKKLLVIFLFWFTSCNGQTQILGIEKFSVPAGVPILVVFAGESNAGGLGDNADATAPELAPRSLFILNNTTRASLDSLEVGVNNLIGHVGLIYAMNDGHGMELGLANIYADGDFGGREVFLCKAGQGGTRIFQWDGVNTYTAESQTVNPYDTFLVRVQSAITLVETLTGETPFVVMFWSQGINDMTASYNPEDWKVATKAVFAAMRSDLAIDLPIFTTEFQDVSGMSAYTAKIIEYEGEMANIYGINTTGAEQAQLCCGVAAGGHWGYTGWKQIAATFAAALISIL